MNNSYVLFMYNEFFYSLSDLQFFIFWIISFFVSILLEYFSFPFNVNLQMFDKILWILLLHLLIYIHWLFLSYFLSVFPLTHFNWMVENFTYRQVISIYSFNFFFVKLILEWLNLYFFYSFSFLFIIDYFLSPWILKLKPSFLSIRGR